MYFVFAVIVIFSFILNAFLLVELISIKNYYTIRYNSINLWLKDEINKKRLYRKLVLALTRWNKSLLKDYSSLLNKKDRVFKLLKNKNKSL